MLPRLFRLFFFLAFTISDAFSQLKPGFSATEYLDFLGITAARVTDTSFTNGIPQNPDLKKVFESPIVGLENKWFLWVNEENKTA